ncbi:MAG TPA: hypothetical protein PK544_04445 [Spirochaetota bacterium]|nr:hypothetical protein [Spirochaetota bacterium]
MKRIVIILYILSNVTSLYSVEKKENTDNTFVTKQKRFIATLFAQEKYFDSIAETGRLLQYSHNSSLVPEYTYFISLNYFLGGQYATVVDRTSGPACTKFQTPIRNVLLRSRCFLKLGNTAQALSELDTIPYNTIGKKAGFELFIRKTELLVLSDRYMEVLNEISRYETCTPGTEEIQSLRKDISRYNSLKRKSAALSVLLSAGMPGAGQAYCGKFSEALLSFAAVALSGAGTWYAMDRGEKSLGMTLGFFTVLLYSGNLYGAYNSAQSYNRHLYTAFRSGIVSTHIPDYDPSSYIDIKKVFK